LPSGMDCFDMARATLDGQPAPAIKYTAPVMARSDRPAWPRAWHSVRI